MNTLFPAESAKDISGIRKKMQTKINPASGKPLYGAAYALSLIVFYAFALQCISTMAVMKRETGGWKLPILQFFVFGGIAYIMAFTTFHLAELFL
jgi:ferrous iron transport protein B